MSIYVNLHRKIWNDDKFPFVSDDCQLVFFHLMSTPLGTQFGLFKSGVAGLAEEKRWPLDRYRRAFDEAVDNGFIEYDERSLLVRIKRFSKYNRPNNPNVLKSWAKQFHELPDSPLKEPCFSGLKALCKGMNEAFREAFAEAFAKPLAKVPEQYSDSDSDTNTNTTDKDSARNSISKLEKQNVFDNDPDLSAVKSFAKQEKNSEINKPMFDPGTPASDDLDEIGFMSMSERGKNFVKNVKKYWPEYYASHAIDTLGAVLNFAREWDEEDIMQVLLEARQRWPSDRKVYLGIYNKLHPYLVATFQNESKAKKKKEATDKAGKPKRDIDGALSTLSDRIRRDESIDPDWFRGLINEANEDRAEFPASVRVFTKKLTDNKMILWTKNGMKIEQLAWDIPRTPTQLYSGGAERLSASEVRKLLEDAKLITASEDDKE